MYKYLFGPVPSRRLGKSLGLDMVAPKTCNMNCVFCECGVTREFVTERKSYINIEEAKKEIIDFLKTSKPDCITFSGDGEPTLSRDLGEMINWIKDNTDVKVVVITNSALLYDKKVRDEISRADIIIPTINSAVDITFKKINRPQKNISADMIKEGIKLLGEEFKGKIYLETFIIEGINDSEEELLKLAEFLQNVKYTKMQLNKLDRPGTEKWVLPASPERLEYIKNYLEGKGLHNVEVLGKFHIDEKDKIEKNQELLENMKSKRIYSKEEIEAIYK